jgi:hypothetical protein
VSKARAKKKRRQRARAAGLSAAAKAPRGDGAGAKGARSAKAPPAAAKASLGDGAGAKGARSAKAPPAAAKTSLGQRAAAKAASYARAPRGGGVPAPKPIWAPFPLTEIGMAAGIIIFGAGFESSSSSTLSIGALVLAVVVGEHCLREHFAGFRSHTLLLAALPVAIVHGFVARVITDAYRGPLTLAVDLIAGGALAWWLRGRYRVARERALPA